MKKDLMIFRAVEGIVATAIVVAIYVAISSGALGSISSSFGSWYSAKVDGMFVISVTDTSVKLPHLDRASLPLPPQGSEFGDDAVDPADAGITAAQTETSAKRP